MTAVIDTVSAIPPPNVAGLSSPATRAALFWNVPVETLFDEPFFRSPIGQALLAGSVAVAFGSLALPYLAVGRSFGLVPVSGPVLLALGLVSAAYVASSEVVKRMFFRRT